MIDFLFNLMLSILYYFGIFLVVYYVADALLQILPSFSKLKKDVDEIKSLLKSLEEAVTLEMFFLINGKWESSTMAKKVLKVGEVGKAKLVAKDAFGNVAKLDGAPVWSSQDPDLTIGAVSEDGMSAEFSSTKLNKVDEAGNPIPFKLQAVGDALIGEGQKDVIAEGEVETVAGDAVTLEMSFE